MDGIVCSMIRGDEKIRIDDRGVPTQDLFFNHRVHVVNVDSVMDLITFDPQIAT